MTERNDFSFSHLVRCRPPSLPVPGGDSADLCGALLRGREGKEEVLRAAEEVLGSGMTLVFVGDSTLHQQVRKQQQQQQEDT